MSTPVIAPGASAAAAAKNRRQLILLALLAVTAVLVFGWRFISPHVSELSGEAADIRAQANTLNRQASEAEAVAADLGTFNARRDALTKAIPATASEKEVISALQSAAKASGVAWVAYQPSAGAPDSVSVTNVTLTVSGRPDRITTYLDALAKLPRLVVVDQVALQDTNGAVTASITARLFSTDETGAGK